MPWQLVIGRSGRRIPLTRGDSVVGSGPKSAVRLEHPTISRSHARLRVGDAQNNTIVIEDLESSNGTRVAGRLLHGRLEVSESVAVEFGLVQAELRRLDEDDATAAFTLDTSKQHPQPSTASRTHATLVAEHASRFMIEVFPDLLAFARSHPGTAAMAARIYAEIRRAFTELECCIEAPPDRVLAGHRIDSDAHVDEATAGRFRVRVHGRRPLRVNAAPVLELCVGLLDLLDQAGESPTPSSSGTRADGDHAQRPEPATVNPAVIEIYDRAERVAPSRLNVLIQGETGTGKELLARFVHAASGRRGDFVALNCAALSRDLLEAELFGIEAGVATGVSAREGRFLQADGGTLLLDEVTEMPDECQAKLLRVLQEGEVVAVGARHPRRIDARVIAATNRVVSPRSDDAGPLRPDLVHRLAGWSATLPPLRDRSDDIPQLAAHFFERAATHSGRTPAGLSRSAMNALCAYDWPGNVRELEAEMQRAALFVDDGELASIAHLSPAIAGASERPAALQDVSADAQRQAIEQALASHDGNATRAAQALDISRATLYRRMRNLGIRR